MAKKTLTTFLLSALTVLCLGLGIFTATIVKTTNVQANDDLAYYEVDSVEIHPHSNTNTMLYMQMSTMDGQSALTGYTGWVASDAATEAFKTQLLINGETPKGEVVVQGMDIPNALCISNYYLPDGGTIVIPEGTTFENDLVSLKFMRTFTITWNAENNNYTVTRTKRDYIVPEYDMPDGMLSDFTENAVIRFTDASFQEAAVNNPGNCWGGDYQSYKISGSYLDEDESPDGSTNGTYMMSWESIETLFYPQIMFHFPQDVEFNIDDDLIFRIYLSEGMDLGFRLWITSSLTPNIWDAQLQLEGATLSKGEWLELSVSPADFVDENGKIAPIAFTFYYYTSPSVTAAAQVYFDTAKFVPVEKVLSTDYKVQDISEIIPIGDGVEYTGEYEGNSDEFDTSKEINIKFIRKDLTVNAVKMMLTINDLSDFDIYFVLNGSGNYNTRGGIYYWFSEKGFNMGYTGKNFSIEALPSSVVAGQAFELELRAIPYYVAGIPTGFYAQAFINGEEIGESGYVPTATASIGKWFGFYMHNTTSDVTVNIKPVNPSAEPALKVSLGTKNDVTEIGADDYVRLVSSVSGNFNNQSEIVYEVVSGNDYAYIDDQGYLNGLKDGVIVIVAKVTNAFGTFTSNELSVKIGAGLPVEESVKDSETTSQSQNKGCKNSLGGTSCLALLALAGAVCLKRKNK